MPRQLLTFLFVFVIIMFAMRACAPKDTLPAAVITEKVPELPGEDQLSLNESVILARDGSVHSVTLDGKAVIRPVASWRRAFQVYIRLADGSKRMVPSDRWRTTEVEGGREFLYTEDELKIVKTIGVAQDGRGLEMRLQVSGAREGIAGIELDAASGVALPAPDAAVEAGIFRRLSGDRLRFSTLTDLVQQREQRRGLIKRQEREGKDVPKSPTYYERNTIDPGQTIERFGILGAEHYVSLESVAGARATNVDVYRARRDDSTTNEIETWISLDLAQGALSGEFKLQWAPRADIKRIEPDLGERTKPQEAKTHRIENDTLRVDFSDRGASIKSLWLKKFSIDAGDDPVEENWIPMIRDAVPSRHRSLTLRGDKDKYGVNLDQAVWEAMRGPDGKSIKFILESQNGYRFVKVIRLPDEDRYDLGVIIRIQRPQSSADTSANYTLVGPAGSYIEDSYRGIIGAQPPSGLLMERGGGESDDEYIESIAKDEEPFAHTYGTDFARGYLRAVAVRGAFFVCALITEERADSKGRAAGDVTEARVKPLDLTRAIPRADGEESRQSLKAQIACAVPMRDGEAVSEYRFYAGPNRRTDLKPLQIEDAVEFGFFGAIGRLLMWLMKSLQGLFGSYGLAIMFMTLIVRACLMPVSYKTQLGMMRYSKRIQKIKPLLDDIQKRFANNRRKLNEERMRIMRENKVGFPLGCLMIFFQIPIWFALFSALRVEFDLRHEPFLWATDLSMPDRLFDLSFWPGSFNLLPICMLVLWVIQQRLAPSPGGDDPQVKMQMKMMRFMPYMFFIFLYKYAAALSVYMCVSSAWGIVEAKFVRKAVKHAEGGDDATGPIATTS